ncbi:DUF6928 family protein [Bradyrhizobium mercantei]|uniref:DUF6928 family protein n=1 Tax=Bradyrhizobium mercantei TaxID=1904807 RepID=UPI000976244A|nr:hypothetical protein [Bradyrhizobium mercantei]
MTWNTQTMLIRPARIDGGPERLLDELGYHRYGKVDEAPFRRAGAGSIWIGAVDDCTIIYSHLVGHFYEEDRNELDQASAALKNSILRRFSDAEIAILALHSVVAHWGFAVYRQGRLIRRQHGYDGIVLADEGPRLPVEEAYLAKFERHDVDGEVTYRDPAHPEYDDMTEPDLGEAFVFEICKSFTGVSLDRLNADGANFWLDDDEAEVLARQKRVQGGKASRPWWKFWR